MRAPFEADGPPWGGPDLPLVSGLRPGKCIGSTAYRRGETERSLAPPARASATRLILSMD